MIGRSGGGKKSLGSIEKKMQGFPLAGAFPNVEDFPSGCKQLKSAFVVAFTICGELFLPVVDVAFWR